MSFPVNGVLDSFTRADVTNSLGANWTGVIRAAWGSHGILSNQAYPAGNYRSTYWSASQFGPDCEVYATLPVIGNVGANPYSELWARLQNPGNDGTRNGYFLRLTLSSAYIGKNVAGAETILGGSIATPVSGDKWGLEIIGTTINAYRDSGSGWSLISTKTDSSVSGAGYIGFDNGNDTSARFDEFGGGTIGAVAGDPGRMRMGMG